MKGPKAPKREIPAARVAAFIEDYIDSHYELSEKEPTGTTQFAFDTGLPERSVHRIRNLESANVGFDYLDQILTKLDRIEYWHLSPEDGGFADYYGDEPGPAAEPTIEQQRRNELLNAKRRASATGRDWLEVLMERARSQMELACA